MAYVPLHLQKYPGMERQDLTQGQLGSFKFTPVDNGPHPPHVSVQNWLNTAAQLQMRQQLQESVEKAVAVQSESWKTLTSSKSRHETPHNRLPASTQSPLTYSFFNEHIKADLGESRLKFGPAALRSAVEIHSPEKRADCSRALSDIIPHSANMNPIASSFVPSVQNPGSNLDETSRNLYSALEREQQAHQKTHSVLLEAVHKIQDVEADNKKLRQHIGSLVNTVNMLGHIVKHNGGRKNGLDEAASAAISTEASSTGATKTEPAPIVYNVITRRRAESDTKPVADPTEPDGPTEVATTQPAESQADESNPFNLDRLDSSTSTDSPRVALNQRLQEHFLLDSDKDAQTHTLASTAMRNTDDSSLIQITPDHINEMAIQARIHDRHSTKQTQCDTMSTPTKASSTTATDTRANEGAKITAPLKVELAETPTLQLPAAFLAKYQCRSKKSNPTSSQPKDSETDALSTKEVNNVRTSDSQHSRSSSPGAPGKPVKIPGSLDFDHADIPTPPMRVQASSELESHLSKANMLAENRLQKVIYDFGGLRLNIKWKVTAENPIYQDEKEKVASVGPLRANFGQSSGFWEHPVRYIEYLEKDLFRTVMIDNIPLGSTYEDVLENIWVDAIEKIELFGPIGNATDYMTARIVFHYERAASLTANCARHNPLIIRDKPVRAWQVATQTYPKNQQLERDVFENMYTRLLLISFKATVPEEVENQMRALLPIKLDWLRESIVEIGKTSDGIDMIEFTSVAAATQAMQQLRTDEDFGGIVMDFDEDPCSVPYPPDRRYE